MRTEDANSRPLHTSSLDGSTLESHVRRKALQLLANTAAGAPPLEMVDRWECNALHYAATWGYATVAERLLVLGCQPQRRNGDRLSALDLSAKWDNDDVFNVLLAATDAPGFSGWSQSELFQTLITTSKQNNPVPDALLDRTELNVKHFAIALGCAVQLNRYIVADQLLQRFAGRNLLLLPFTTDLMAQVEAALGGEDDGGARKASKDEGSKVKFAIPSYGKPPTLGEAMLFIALSNDAHELAVLLCRAGADPGFDATSDSHLTSKRKPFGLALSISALQAARTMLPAGFLNAPGLALYACVRISATAKKRAAVEAVRDPPLSMRLTREAVQAEVTALALMQSLPEKRQMDLLRSDEGEEFIRFAARLNSLIILSQPIVQRDMEKRWRGAMLESLLTGMGVNPWGEQVALTTSQWLTITGTLVFVCVPINLMLLPMCAIFPPARYYAFRQLRAIGDEGEVHGVRRETGYCEALKMWWEDAVLIEVPFFKAWLRHLSNAAFATVLITSAGSTAFRLTWATSLLVSCSLRMLFDHGNIYIKWDAWMLLAASALLTTGIVFDLVDGVDPPVRQGILALGQLLLNLDTIANVFLQSTFFGPMVLSISQMLVDMMQWVVISVSVGIIFSFAMMVKSAGDEDFEFGQLIMYFWNVGTKVSPLLGPRPLLLQTEQDTFDFIFIQGYFIIGAVMLYSMLVAIFSTRLSKDDSTRVPTFQKGFSKLVINEHLQSPVAPPLHALTAPYFFLAWLRRHLAAASQVTADATINRKSSVSMRSREGGGGVDPVGLFTSEHAQSETIVETRWHDLDYLAKYSFDSLTAHVRGHVDQDLVKREGALKATTAAAKFQSLEAKVHALEGVIKETRQALEDGLSKTAALAKMKTDDTDTAGSLAPLQHTLHKAAAASEEGSLQILADGSYSAVRVYGGFAETAVRLVFPYGDHYAAQADTRKVYHTTILKDGIIENPTKRLYLGGNYSEFDREDLDAMTVKKLKEELDEHEGCKELAARLDDKAELVKALMGKPRDLKIADRAVCAFPMLQTIPLDKALPHLEPTPNNIFVFKRDNGTYGVVHCWPIKFNQDFQKRFTITEDNPDPAKFSPRMAAEMKACMHKLFGGAKRSSLLAACCGGGGGGGGGGGDGTKLKYCSSTSWNGKTCLTGTAPEMIAFLRQNPRLQQHLNIAKLEPDGFTARVKIKGKFSKEKEFHMASSTAREEHVVYVKQGYEEMASVKPLDLFHYDCEFGRELSELSELYQDHVQAVKPGALDA